MFIVPGINANKLHDQNLKKKIHVYVAILQMLKNKISRDFIYNNTKIQQNILDHYSLLPTTALPPSSSSLIITTEHT